MQRISLIIIAGVIFGLLAKKYHFPGGAIVGSMLGSAAIALLAPGIAAIPTGIATTVELILGISLGLSFDRSFLSLIGRLMPAALLSTLGLLITSILMAFIAKRFGIVDFATAIFGFAPGGMAGMSLLAQTEGYQTSVVAFFHTVRLFVLFVIVPVLVRIFLIK
jgi:uncharacterized protein